MEKLNGQALGLGLCFFVVFWIVFDSLALGIALGVALGAAFHSTPTPTSAKDTCLDESNSGAQHDIPVDGGTDEQRESREENQGKTRI